MPVHKRKRNGRIDWYYKFNMPGSTRGSRGIIRAFGFNTKQAATDAEAARREEERKRRELAEISAAVSAEVPQTLRMVLDEFMRQHAIEHLALKTIERYREQSAYLLPELLAMPINAITALHLNRDGADY